MPTSANYPKNPNDVRADVGIRAPILPLSHQPLTNGTMAIIPLGATCRAEAQRSRTSSQPLPASELHATG